MSMAFGRPQGEEVKSHVDTKGGQKP